MSDFTLTYTEDRRRVLLAALAAHAAHAQKRLDPDFVPKPGHKDRNVETIRLCYALDTAIRNSNAVTLDYDAHRVMRTALERYAKACMHADPVDLSGEQIALSLLEILPYAAVGLPPREAEVTPRSRYG